MSDRIRRLHEDKAKRAVHVFGDGGYLLTLPLGFRDRRLKLGAAIETEDIDELKEAGRSFEAGRSERRRARSAERAARPPQDGVVVERTRDARGRCYLLLDPGGWYRVTLEDHDRYGVGRDLIRDEVAALHAGGNIARVLESVDRLCAVRPRTARELRERLARKGMSGPAVEGAIERRMRSGNVLSDDDFARWFLERRGSGKGKSARAVAGELGRLVEDRGAIERAAGAESEETKAETLVKAKARARRGLDLSDERDRRRFSDRMARRGFGWSEIKRALEAPDEE